MMSVEMARTAVGRTTIECCVRWCATRCAGWDTAEMTSAESSTSARPTCSWCCCSTGSQCSVWSSELTSHRRGACRMIRAALFWTRWSFWIMLDAAQSYSSRVSRESGCMRAFMLSPASVNGACGGSRVHGNCTIALQLTRTSKLQRGVAVYVYSN